MPNARIIDAADAAVELILSGWTGRGSDDGAERVYAPPIHLSGDEGPHLAGRHVYVFPFPYSAESLTRDAQWRRYSLRVLAVERYSQAGDPPTLWMDERVYWFEQKVFNPLAAHSLKLMEEFSPDLDAIATVDEVYARDTLIEHKTFWSYATFPFAEPTDLTGAP